MHDAAGVFVILPSAPKGPDELRVLRQIDLNGRIPARVAVEDSVASVPSLVPGDGSIPPVAVNHRLYGPDGVPARTALLRGFPRGVADVVDLVMLESFIERLEDVALDQLLDAHVLADEGVEEVPSPERGDLGDDAGRVQPEIP